MLASLRTRAVVVAVLLAGAVGLCVWFGSLGPDPAVGAYPGNDELGADYDRYLGQPVVVSGEAVASDPVVVRAEYGVDGRAEYTIVRLDRPVRPGDGVWVFGIPREGGRIHALGAVVTPLAHYTYTYAVSFLAGVWVLALIVRDWRFDGSALGLVPRADEAGGTSSGRRSATPSGTGGGPGGDDDA